MSKMNIFSFVLAEIKTLFFVHPVYCFHIVYPLTFSEITEPLLKEKIFALNPKKVDTFENAEKRFQRVMRV